MNNLKYIVLFLAVSLLVLGASADENATVNQTENGSIVIIETPIREYNVSHFPASNSYRISQGQHVYLNETIDISGMGWGTGFAWYGRHGEYDLPLYIREFKDYRHDLMNFYIDPAIFLNRGGMWYQYYGNATEKNGNLAAFFVEGYFNSTLTFPNGTVVNETIPATGNQTPLVIPQESILPEVHEADYLLAIGDPLILKSYGPAQVWIFGRMDKDYGSTSNDNMTFPASGFLNFEPGSYTIIVQHPGNNTEFDVRYTNGIIQYQDGWNGVKTVDVSALQPRMIQNQLITTLTNTDDTYITYSLEIQEPVIAIRSIDDVWLHSKMLEFHIDPKDDVVFKDIRGYTNLRNGTNITVVLDKNYNGLGKARFTTYADVSRSAPGNRTMFQAYIPIIWNTIPLGMHTITATGPFGSYVDANFPVELLPPDSFRPNTTLKYTGDSNPWKPNLTVPTPIVVTVPGPTQIVTVKVTPSPEEIKAAQDAVISEKEANWVRTVLILAALVGSGAYLYSVVRRWKQK